MLKKTGKQLIVEALYLDLEGLKLSKSLQSKWFQFLCCFLFLHPPPPTSTCVHCCKLPGSGSFLCLVQVHSLASRYFHHSWSQWWSEDRSSLCGLCFHPLTRIGETSVSFHTCTHTHTHTHTHTQKHGCTHANTHTHTQACTHTYKHRHAYTHTHTHTHTHRHNYDTLALLNKWDPYTVYHFRLNWRWWLPQNPWGTE